MRTDKELLVASTHYAKENRAISWWHLASTLAVLSCLIGIAMSDTLWLVRGAASLLAGLTAVRMFIIYHDFQHGAILRNSRVATGVMWLYGLIMLNPPSVWNRSHNHHHKNNSKGFGANVGSYPILTTDAFAEASLTERFLYAASRHPITILFGYILVFLWGMSLRPFLLSPARHADGLIAILVHFSMMFALTTVGWEIAVFGMVIPMFVAMSLGAYLFYAQHNFPAAELKERCEWSHVDAALRSSSCMKMGPLMHWFTGNIGYHHVHHLNARIPFYRLPEAMAGLEELQEPGMTSLSVTDIAACLRLKLWSPEKGRFVSFRGI